jgi:adenylate cyclase
MNRDMLSRRLRKHGFDVDVAIDGHDALGRLGGREYDLVLLDVMMPGLSGLDVLEIIRSTRSPAELPVIMATAQDASEDVVAALGRGASDYVTKPLDLSVVLARVKTQLTLKRIADDNRALLRDLEIRNRFIRQTFGRYLSDDIVSSLLDEPSGLELGGEKRRISILITDLRGFSSISEELEPKDVVAILNAYFEIMTGVILDCGGTIDEFIGDSILVFFGAPSRRDDHAAAAVRCALRMQLAMAEVDRRNEARGFPPLEMGIGIHTGEVIVGNVGSERRTKYGAVGSSVNLASRIESFTVGGQILVSESNWNEAGPLVHGGTMEVHPKGVAGPVRLYDIVGVEGDESLQLPQRTVPLVALDPPMQVEYVVMREKNAGGVTLRGEFTRMSLRGGELRTSAPVPPFANLRFTLDGGEELYAKALEASSEESVPVRFTTVGPGLRDKLKLLL